MYCSDNSCAHLIHESATKGVEESARRENFFSFQLSLQDNDSAAGAINGVCAGFYGICVCVLIFDERLVPQATSKKEILLMKTTITHAAIIFANVPFTFKNQHMGIHPYVVVANNLACKHSPILHCVPLTSRTEKRHLPVHTEVSAACFSQRTVALAEQLTLLPREILEQGRYCGQLSEESMAKLRQAIKIQLALD